MKRVVLLMAVVLCGAVWTTTANADGPPACRPLRPAPVTTAVAVELRTQPAELLPEPQPAPAEALPAPAPTPAPTLAPSLDGVLPAPEGGLQEPAPPGPEYVPLQRVDPAPWAYMKCIPRAACRTPCYADCIPCEARMFRSTAPKCCHQAMTKSLHRAVWNFIDLHLAFHECCDKLHNTYCKPDPWRRPYPYDECR